MQNYGEIWNAVIELMKNDYSGPFINLWFSQTVLSALTSTKAILTIPSNFKRNMIEEKYLPMIRGYLETVLGYDIEVIILSSENGMPDLSRYTDTGLYTDSEATHSAQNNPSDTDENDSFTQDSIAFLSSDAKKRCTFDNFLVGSSNKFARAAAYAVAKDPVIAYNPLFIYGASGLGKTHLLYAITNYILDKDPNTKIMYVTGEDFTNQMIRSISNHDTESFRNKFRNCNVFLIDDVQFIAGKVGTQEEFFHTFNALYEDGKQIILTSDRPPKDINPLEDRLRNRFEWGLLADIQPPNLELRIAIMKENARKMGISMPDEVYVYLAENLTQNIRQLEGALKKIAAKSYLEGSVITFELAKASVSDMISGTPPTAVTIDRIISVVSQKYGVTRDDLKSKKKSANIVNARHKCVYLIRKLTDMSLSKIGEIFGKDHTTIMNSINNVEKEIKNNSSFESEMNDIIAEIKGINTESK